MDGLSSAAPEPEEPVAMNPTASDVPTSGEMKVPRSDPLKQSIVPPEIVFFGKKCNLL